MSGTTSGVQFHSIGHDTHMTVFRDKSLSFEVIWGGAEPIDITGYSASPHRVRIKRPLKLPSRAVAELSGAWAASAMEAGAVVYCSNGDAGSPCLAVSDGASWRRLVLGQTIAAA